MTETIRFTSIFGLVIAIISAFVDGAANMILTLGVPKQFTLAVMAVMTLWAAVLNQLQFGSAHHLILQSINVAIIVIAAWILIEGVVKFFQTDETSNQERRPDIGSQSGFRCGSNFAFASV